MAGIDAVVSAVTTVGPLLAGQGSSIRGPNEVFSQIFLVFVGLGTLVGVVVIGYTLYNAYHYREGTDNGSKVEEDPPEVGELPTGGGGGKKLALSFALSAIIVVGLIIWTYTALLYVDTGPEPSEDDIEVQVTGFQFGWEFTYENGASTTSLHAPANQTVWLNVTSRDVFHNFGIRELGVKTDAIPGMYSEAWFQADDPAQYQAVCYELCGSGHSYMVADVTIHSQEEFEQWYANQEPAANETEASS